MLKKTPFIILIFSLIFLNFSLRSLAQFQDTGDFRIVSPNSNTRIEAGTDQVIKWANASYTARNLFRIRIELHKDTELIQTFTENTYNTGEYTAFFLSSLKPGRYRIKIITPDGIAFSFSEEFEIIAPIPIKILEPNARDIWYLGDSCNIMWQDDYPDSKVYIDLLRVDEEDGLTFIEKIADAIANEGRFNYTVSGNLKESTYVIGIRIPPIKEIKYSKPFLIKKEGVQ